MNETTKQRREKLAAVIMGNATRFYIGDFYTSCDIHQRKLAEYNSITSKSLEEFTNECGTSLCIAGFIHVLWPELLTQVAGKDDPTEFLFGFKHLDALAKHIGVERQACTLLRSPLFFHTNWPAELLEEFVLLNGHTRYPTNPRAVAAVAIKAIEHFAVDDVIDRLAV